MPITLNGDTGIQTPMYNGTITANAVTPSVNMKNRIINGAMVIDQRNAGASVSTSSGGSVYTLDRWQAQYSQTSKFTVQQNAGSVTPPAGFTNYLGATSSSAYSVGAAELFDIRQLIEGFNTADLDFGKSTAKTITISFWVRSSLTGTFSGYITNSAFNRAYVFTYTISSANTWTQASVTIAGDTSGTWLTTNGNGLQLGFNLGCGSSLSGTAGVWQSGSYFGATGATSVVGTNGATFYITGVQLEVGSTATSFDYRPYGTELALCQRYYIRYGFPVYTPSVGDRVGVGFCDGTTTGWINLYSSSSLRATPTINSSGLEVATGIANTSFSVSSALFQQTQIVINFTTTGATSGRGCNLRMTGSTSFIDASAEL